MTRKQHRKRTLGKVDLLLGGTSTISLNLLRLIAEFKKPTAKKVFAKDQQVLKSDTVYVCTASGSRLSKQDMWRGFDFGGRWVYFGPEELREATGDLCPAGLELLGFHARDRLKPYHNLDIAYFAEPCGSVVQSTPRLAVPKLGSAPPQGEPAVPGNETGPLGAPATASGARASRPEAASSTARALAFPGATRDARARHWRSRRWWTRCCARARWASARSQGAASRGWSRCCRRRWIHTDIAWRREVTAWTRDQRVGVWGCSVSPLLPQALELDAKGSVLLPCGLHLLPLPYADDLRKLSLPPPLAPNDLSEAQQACASKLVEALTLPPEMNPAGRAQHPGRHKHFAFVQAKAVQAAEVRPTQRLPTPVCWRSQP